MERRISNHHTRFGPIIPNRPRQPPTGHHLRVGSQLSSVAANCHGRLTDFDHPDQEQQRRLPDPVIGPKDRNHCQSVRTRFAGPLRCNSERQVARHLRWLAAGRKRILCSELGHASPQCDEANPRRFRSWRRHRPTALVGTAVVILCLAKKKKRVASWKYDTREKARLTAIACVLPL